MKYKVGDRVRVRDWDDMKKEYGLDRDGDINIRPCFATGMKKFCGKIVTITGADGENYHIEGDNECWFFTDKMFEGYAQKFKVGDKVRVIKVTDHRKCYVGEVFTIRSINPNGERCYNETHYGVNGDCNYIFLESELEPVTCTRKIIITTDGKETFARFFEGGIVVKSATAKCNPEDKFNFETGAKLAFDRLFERSVIDLTPFKKFISSTAEAAKKIKQEPKPKYKAGDKVKVIANNCCHKIEIGEIHTIKCLKGKAIMPENKFMYDLEDSDYYVTETDIEPYTEPKFEVGKYYKHKEHGCIIKVTSVEGDWVKYEIVEGKEGGAVDPMTCFSIGSIYSQKLEPIDYKEYFNGKVVCVKTDYDWWTVGKIYEVKNGIIVADDGEKYPKSLYEPYRDAEDVRHAGCSCAEDGRHNSENEFVPIVE